MDDHTPEQRRKNMRNIRVRGTNLERMIAHGLHAMGFRYRLNVSTLPGSPDLVFPKYHAVIFTHGCFWHGHDCHRSKTPTTRTEFWIDKIAKNSYRDRRDVNRLLELNWRVMLVWECAVRGRTRLPLQQVLEDCRAFLISDKMLFEVQGSSIVE